MSNVKFVSITPEAEKHIVYCARVSNPANQASESYEGLLKYCIKHKHWSIFELASLTLEINTSRAIAAQILRHRSFSFQEFCMSGKSNVYFENGTRTLEELYSEWTKDPNKIRDLNVLIFDEEEEKIKTSHIKEVFQTGVKDIFKITLENEKVIKCTKEHKILTPDGFHSLDYYIGLRENEGKAFIDCCGEVGCYNTNTNLLEWSKIKTVEYLGPEMTYDLEIDHISHNYVADGVVVHNSQRYSDTNSLSEVIPLPDLRRQDVKNKQNSIDDIPDYLKLKLLEEIRVHFEKSQALYNRLLDAGVAKECSRAVLPLATPTRLYMSGTIRSWITYIALREKNGTQKEHMDIAKECKVIFNENLPTISSALGGMENEWSV
jgi:thymidylate synthase ThyX